MRPFYGVTTSLALLVAATGCSSTSPSDLGPSGRVALKLSTTPAGGAAASLLAPGITVTQGGDVLVITDVQVVARKIKLERENGSCPTPVVEGSGHDADEEGTDDCPNLRLGPMLLDPPIGEGVESSFTVDLPIGTYHELKMQIHKPTSSSTDAAFLALYPDFAGTSIKVTGTFNGLPFTFTTSLTAEVEVEFATPIVVTEGDVTSLTLRLDVRRWFEAQGDASLLNPLTLSQQDRQRVEQNIRASFHAFEDEDEDGVDD